MRVFSLVAILAVVVWTVTGCSGVGRLFTQNASALIGQSARNVVIQENAQSPLTSAPDGMVLRTIHLNTVRLHLGLLYRHATGYVSVREYTTPFGVITFIQSHATVAPNSTPASQGHFGPQRASVQAQSVASSTTQQEIPIIYNGSTTHGASWFVLQPDQRWRLHVQFPDSSVDGWVPVGLPAATARMLAEAVY